MGMRETPRSLRIYFLLVGLVGCYVVYEDLQRARTFPIFTMLAGVQALLAAGYLGFGLTLPTVLRKHSQLLIGFLVLAAILNLGINGYDVFLASRLLGGNLGLFVLPAFSLLLSIYLIVNVRRLSHEATEPERKLAAFD
jgi:hypothetical protein